jgi:uncharacterized OB-fold protein
VTERPVNDHSFEQFLREGKLMGARCSGCNTLYLPPRLVCIKCFNSGMEWIEVKGTGNLAAFTCITIGPSFMAAEGYDRKNPYCTGVVELDEKVRMVARIEGVDPRNPESIKVGTPMKVKFLHRGSDENTRTFLAFEPVLE